MQRTPGLLEAVVVVEDLAELLGSLLAELSRWAPLCQDQYLEIRTLLSGYLLSAQGDRMLMVQIAEGRFPFLDKNVMALAASLPPSYKLRVLDEKHVLKRAARGDVPAAILERARSKLDIVRDALAGAEGGGATGRTARAPWIREVLEPGRPGRRRRVRAERGGAALAQVYSGRLRSVLEHGQHGAGGIPSTQLAHEMLVRRRLEVRAVELRTCIIDRTAGA